MPPLPDLTGEQLNAVIRYVLTALPRAPAVDPAQKTNASSTAGSAPVPATASDASRYKSSKGWFNDPDGYPAITPPWGTLSAIDMNTGKYLWKIPLGYYPELAEKGLKDTGTLNYGGPLVTGGGIVFIAATAYDRKFRAFEKDTGQLLWTGDLPFPGLATPATYLANGKQFVLIATGGIGGGSQFRGATGGVYVAFALP